MDYCFYDMDFLFHGGTAVFEEFALCCELTAAASRNLTR